MTPDEAKQVLAAARQSAQFDQWDDVDHLLRPVYDLQLLTGTDQGDAAHLLGLSYMHTGAWEAARAFLSEASTTASPGDRAEAVTQLAEITRHDAAIRAESDGLVEQSEAATVLAAADDAVARGDLDAAYDQYWSAYDGQSDAGLHAKAALGIATVWAHRADYVQAEQYAHYVVNTGQPAPAAQATKLLSWIKDQRDAATSAADGTTADEYAKLSTAAKDAFFNRDYAQALQIVLSILAAPQLGTTEHVKAAMNAGLAETMMGQFTEARGHFEFVVSHGTSEQVQKAQARLTTLDQHDVAEQLVAEFEE